MIVLPPDEVPVAVAPVNYLKAASSLERLHEYAEARQAYQAAIQRWPDNALAWAGAGNVAFALNDFASAESAYRQALTLSPANALLMNNLALALAEQGCVEQARTVIDCALGRFPDIQVLGITAEEISQLSGGGTACRAFRCPLD